MAWTEKCAYFAVKYDGSEWVADMPLAPTTDFKPTHLGCKRPAGHLGAISYPPWRAISPKHHTKGLPNKVRG